MSPTVRQCWIPGVAPRGADGSPESFGNRIALRATAAFIMAVGGFESASIIALVATALVLGAYGVESMAQEASSNATTACMVGVNSKYGGQVKNLSVVSSEFSQANSEVILQADGERWRCLVSNDGEVQELTKQHAPAPSGNNAKEWDRGCSDAKSGSYDRSKHGKEYEAGWNACKK